MPEGPSIIIATEAMHAFAGRKIIEVDGNSKIDQQRLVNKKLLAIKTWGKHLLICFSGFTVRVHFLLFGSYLVNARKKNQLRLGLVFAKGEINFYACNVKIIEGDLDEVYDWSADVMSDAWNAKKAIKKLRAQQDEMICDALLDQEIFSGVGNIIKNEVLYRVRVHPESKIAKIPLARIKKIVAEARVYSFEFLEWKQQSVLSKHWLAYAQKTCRRCDLPIIKKYTGKQKRRSFYCSNCQKLYK